MVTSFSRPPRTLGTWQAEAAPTTGHASENASGSVANALIVKKQGTSQFRQASPLHSGGRRECLTSSRHVLRLVQRRHHTEVPRADTEVVLNHLPSPSLGPDAGRSVRPLRRPGLRAPGRGPDPDHTDASGLGTLLSELARQLEDGRIYDRDLVALATALNTVLNAYSRRRYVGDASRAGGFSISGERPGPVQLTRARPPRRRLDPECADRSLQSSRSGDDTGRTGAPVTMAARCRRSASLAVQKDRSPRSASIRRGGA